MSRNYKQYFISAEEIWKKNLENVKRFIDTNNQRPSSTSNNSEEKQLGCWISSQKTHYQNNERIMRNDEMRKMWEKFVTDDKYKKMSSETLHEHFKTNPNEWEEYHKVSEENEKSFGGSSNIPVNVVIEYLKTKRNKKCKTIVDMGAGKNRLYTELHDNKKFKVIALDHVSNTKEVLCRNMKKTDIEDEEADYVVFCLSLSWSKKEAVKYLEEAHRILDDQGELIICESFGKWNKEKEIKGGEIVDILSPVLKEAGFKVSDEKIKEDGKFMYRVCKKY